MQKNTKICFSLGLIILISNEINMLIATKLADLRVEVKHKVVISAKASVPLIKSYI